MEEQLQDLTYTAFEGFQMLVQGRLDEVALKVKRRLKDDSTAQILIFSDSTGKEMDLDLSGSEKEVISRLRVFISANEATAPSAGPGRPKLGVVAREVSLLPRHWEWLSTQSGGASVTLRRLVDEARKKSLSKESIKQSQERAYKLMSALAGNLPNYEEALRALYRRDDQGFQSLIEKWPADLKAYLVRLTENVFEKEN
jgi:hypothetical protein